MQAEFEYTGSPARIIFGEGSLARTGEALHDLDCRRALVLSTPFQKADAERLLESLGDAAVGIFADAAMHTPVEVTEQAVQVARECDADCTVAMGGGSTTGLGKAIALRIDLPQTVISTTYAGSEVTPILGQTENGRKTTLRSDAVLPEIVIYDPELSKSLPVGMSVTSGIKAIAHAAEALYAQDRNPVSTLMAAEGARALIAALPVIVRDPQNAEARHEALHGTWLCGKVLGTRRHGAASQALPHAGRGVQPAACRNPHRDPAACGRLQRARRARAVGPAGAGPQYRQAGPRPVRVRPRSRRPDHFARTRHAGRRDRPCRRPGARRPIGTRGQWNGNSFDALSKRPFSANRRFASHHREWEETP